MLEHLIVILEGIGDMNKNVDKGYLETEYWNITKKFRMEVDGYRCAICGSGIDIDVYHNTYERLGNERLSDVVTLCKTCHSELCEFLDEGVISAKSLFEDVFYSKACFCDQGVEEIFINNYLDVNHRDVKKTEEVYLGVLEKLISSKNFKYISKWLKNYRKFVEGT